MKKIILNTFTKLKILKVILYLKNFVFMIISYPKWLTLRKSNNIFLELGSGSKKGKNGWVTVDLSGADISYDLSRGIPLPDGLVDRIYTSHMLEHISFNELLKFIQECFRVLKPGGEFSVCVPDAERYIRAYQAGIYFEPEMNRYGPAQINSGSLIDQVNYIAYMDGLHKHMFDANSLINILKKAPFKEVKLRIFDKIWMRFLGILNQSTL
jgi:predicted SAM-dependent methyltransferase